MMKLITLLTDFGTRDPFVALIKAVILGRCPDAQIIDSTHELAPFDVAAGAFWLERSWRWFPPNTVHVAVVDPGVGTSRQALAVRAHGQFFVGPDNGLLIAGDEVRVIDAARWALPSPSRTFHGRDLFAPVAAAVANDPGVFSSLGPIAKTRVPPLLRPASCAPNRVTGEVILRDRFGNLMTNIEAEELAAFANPRVEIGFRTLPLLGTYADSAPGEVLALINAFGVLEIAVHGGEAAEKLGLGAGAQVVVTQS